MISLMRQPTTPKQPALTNHSGPEVGSDVGRQIRFPFAAVVGRDTEKHALLLLAIDPQLRGVMIATAGDSTRRTLARSFGSLVTQVGNRELEPASRPEYSDHTVPLPLNITDERLLGGLELEQTLITGKRHVSPGLLARAHGRVLYVDDLNLLESNTVVHIAHAMDGRRVSLEREGISEIHESDFMFVGTFNPAEGEPSALLRNRIAFIVDSTAESTPDETAKMIRRTFRFDDDPVSLAEEFAFKTAEIKSKIEEARARLRNVDVSRDHIRQIALVAIKLGVEGNRADIFALKAARANAALAGRAAVNEDDLIVAIRLVLAPRATTLPSARQEAERNEEAVDRPDGETPERCEPNPELLPPSIEDLLFQPIDTRVPEEALNALQRTARSSKAAPGKRIKASRSPRGRYVGSIIGRNGDARVAVDATLRAAAPFQLRRHGERALSSERPNEIGAGKGKLPDIPVRRVKIRPDDLRFKQFKHRSGVLFILAVDSSGSMALNRMSQAKGAATRLLEQAYIYRDQVSLISFRGASAQVLLAPTRSVELAKRLLDALPAGGGTPLSAALVKAIELARFARVKGTTRAMLVLLTDGSANVPLQDEPAALRVPVIEDELRRLGALLESEVTSVVIDTKSRFVSGGKGAALARMLGARYIYLPRSDAVMVYRAIVATAPREQA